MARTYRILHRKWRLRRPMWMMMIPELAGLVPLLVLFGIAQPDLYRTKMWQIGFDNKFNSNPKMVLYAYANHQPLPTVPFVWSYMLTVFNVACSIVTLFLLLVKMVAWIMKVWYPIAATFINAGLVAIWAVSVYGQMGPDHADPRYPSPIAWYISKSCDLAKPRNAVKSCMMAKGTFAATVYMLAIFLVNLGLCIWSMLPNKLNDPSDSDDEEESREKGTNWEMQSMRSPTATGAVPFTPRTQAFHTLDRKLPQSTYT